MANLFLTFTEFLAAIKVEAQLNDTSCDTLILNLTNEILVEIVSSTKNLRDFEIDQDFDIANSSDTNLLGFYFAEIRQIYYKRYNVAIPPVLQNRWTLAEQGGLVCPVIHGANGYPYCYTLRNQVVNQTDPNFQLIFYPVGSAFTHDKIQVIGTAFKFISGGADLMPYSAVYPMLTRSILQRLQIYRNKGKDNTSQWDGLIQRAATGVALGTKDSQGNSENDPT